jgi:hypothetical protein
MTREERTMIANTRDTTLRRKPAAHRTEPRILLRMEGTGANPKLKPTVFLPSLLMRLPEQRRAS